MSVFRVLSAAVVFGIIGGSLGAYTSPHGVTGRCKKELRWYVAWCGLLFALVGFPVLMADGAVPMALVLVVGALVVGLCERARRRRMSGHVSTPEH